MQSIRAKLLGIIPHKVGFALNLALASRNSSVGSIIISSGNEPGRNDPSPKQNYTIWIEKIKDDGGGRKRLIRTKGG